MSVITALIFQCYILVFPWLVLCPVWVCVLCACVGKLQTTGWDDDDEGTESVLEWGLRLRSLNSDRRAVKHGVVFHPLSQLSGQLASTQPGSQTHTSNTTRSDWHSSGEMEETRGQGVFLSFLKEFSRFYHPAPGTVWSSDEVNREQ